MSSFVIGFLPRSKCLLILWLQSLSMLILEPSNMKFVTVSNFSPSICREMIWPDTVIFIFWMLSFKPTFSLSLRDSLVLHFLPLKWYHLYIWDCWYFSQQSWFQLVSHPAQHFVWCTHNSFNFCEASMGIWILLDLKYEYSRGKQQH